MEPLLKTQVKNGRISIDTPTDLPEGTVIELRPRKQLSWEEIKTLYPNEWVVLVDLLFNEPRPMHVSEQILGGVVFDHSPNKKELLARTTHTLLGIDSAQLYTGKISWNKLR